MFNKFIPLRISMLTTNGKHWTDCKNLSNHHWQTPVLYVKL